MIGKLAYRNVRRSARDYAIYFITLALSVALFYAFNSLSSQAVLFDAASVDSLRMFEMLETFMGLFSGAIACVLAFLVVYANRFLIKRRKREFGMYLILGMGSGRVSRILLCEMLMVGITSLAVGLVLGIAISQALAFVTAFLMDETMSQYQFIVSGEAVLFTLACFALIFIVSAIINVVYIRRCKLASLISQHTASEKGLNVRLPLRVVGLVAAVALIIAAYWQLEINGLVMMDEHFWAATILMIVGTTLFFWSVSGFVICLLQRTPSLYYRGLSMFTARQISSKINTAFVSMSVVCVLLFFAITVMATGIGLVDLFVGNLSANTRYDATVYAQTYLLEKADGATDGIDAPYYEGAEDRATYRNDMYACLAAKDPRFASLVRSHAQVDFYYEKGLHFDVFFNQIPGFSAEKYGLTEETIKSTSATTILFYSVGQLNALADMAGEKRYVLADDEFLVCNTAGAIDALAQDVVDRQLSLTFCGSTMHAAGEIVKIPTAVSSVGSNALDIVVPDAVMERALAQGALAMNSALSIMYACPRAEGDALLTQILASAFPLDENVQYTKMSIDDYYQSHAWPVFQVYTAKGMKDQASGFRMAVTYLALYIGFVLLMATATVLAIQQLSETTDSLPRYRRLRTLGAQPRQVRRSLRTQTMVFFLAPLALAACHSWRAIGTIADVLFSELGVSMFGSIVTTAAIVAVIYLGYMAITYTISKAALRERYM